MLTSALLFVFSSNTIYIVLTCFVLTLILIANELNIKFMGPKVNLITVKNDENNNVETVLLKEAPGPKKKIIIGNLDVLSGFEIPYQAFGVLEKKYGKIIKLQLGTVPSMVINGVEAIKEVLVTKGHHFDSRPNFKRYHMLFSGNKENSLAFCDWSDMQKSRRDMLTSHTFPRKFSMSFNRFSEISIEFLQILSEDIKHSMETQKLVSVKPHIQKLCANVFTQYFTTRSFFDKDDTKFLQLIKNFDKIFWEVNQGYAADFLPFLLPFHKNNMKKMEKWSNEIRHFIEENIIGNRYSTWNVGDEPSDYIESLIDHVKRDLQPKMKWNTAMFALEDIIGGHSAVANFVTKVIAFLVKNENVQKKIQREVDDLLMERCEKSVTIADRSKLIYTEATVMETLRLISSPLVPHVASQDSSIDGFNCKSGTLLFLNNYDLNMSPSLWHEPEKFEPERFILNGRLMKPDHFIPFGNGRRSCMGYKMVQFLSFSIIGNLLKEFNIRSLNNEEFKVPVGSLAEAENPYQFAFNLRN